MKTTISSIFFYLLIGFAIWVSDSLWPLFALFLSPDVMNSLNGDDDKDDKDDKDDTNANMQLNS